MAVLAIPVWLLVLIVAGTVAVPLLYVVVTWEHEIVCIYPVLPAPSDLGTKEFRWRCYLSAMTRNGWRSGILRSPCPRITLQSRFALLSTDFAQLTTTLGFKELKLETIPFIFPQIAVSGLMLQLLGNSHFPAALTTIKIKAVTICQLRALDMRFRDEAEQAEAAEAGDSGFNGLHCVMVLTNKRFLDDEIEFSIQTDLFDEQGAVWQSTTCISVPFKQQTLLVPLSSSTAQLDSELANREYSKSQTQEFACTRHNLDEFEAVNVTNLDGTTTKRDVTPLMWIVGRAMGVLQRQSRVPALPLLCSLVFEDGVVPLQSRVACESSLCSDPGGKAITKVQIQHDKKVIVSGLLRTVGWVFDQEPKTDAS